jgi:hypothetical protein
MFKKHFLYPVWFAKHGTWIAGRVSGDSNVKDTLTAGTVYHGSGITRRVSGD